MSKPNYHILIPGTLAVWKWGFMLRLAVIDVGATFHVSKCSTHLG